MKELKRKSHTANKELTFKYWHRSFLEFQILERNLKQKTETSQFGSEHENGLQDHIVYISNLCVFCSFSHSFHICMLVMIRSISLGGCEKDEEIVKSFKSLVQ